MNKYDKLYSYEDFEEEFDPLVPGEKLIWSAKPKKSFDFTAIFKHLTTIKTIKANSKINPKKPISSPITERIKSDSAKGRKACFCLELNRPTPNQPPEPNAYNDCNN